MPRLYLQRGLSDRVIRAVSQRLERVLTMATGAGDHMDGADARTRSRSPVRAPRAEADGPDGTVNVNVLPGESLPLPEGTVPMPEETPLVPGGEVEAPSLDVIPTNPAEPDALRDQLTKCLQKLQSVSFELAAAVDSYGDHHDKLREEVAKLGLKLEKQSQALTTVGASMASEVLEVNKLLKAFDRFAGLFKWAFGGKNSVETNLGFLQACIIEQKSQLETSMLGAMTTMNGLLEKICENTSRCERSCSSTVILPSGGTRHSRNCACGPWYHGGWKSVARICQWCSRLYQCTRKCFSCCITCGDSCSPTAGGKGGCLSCASSGYGREGDDLSLLVLLCGERWRGEEHNPEQC